uniref:PORR domain-containing protein n=1 Tax=Kalanchoe fedtschenkoi TaxID=63787 RepID=A0A7N0SXR4_KALFE
MAVCRILSCPWVSVVRLLNSCHLPSLYVQRCTYVDEYMKWKRDSYYETIDHIHQSVGLRPVITLKNCIVRGSSGCIPVSEVSKRQLQLEVPMKRVASFLRHYPSIFEEFAGEHNHPWFRLTPEALKLHKEEVTIYEEFKSDLIMRLKKLIMMSKDRVLPLKIIRGMQWYLGIPDEFLENVEENLPASFRVVEMGDKLQWLTVDSEDVVLSALQKNAIKRGLCQESLDVIKFPFYPSRGLRLRRKIANWLDEFQNLPYISPYQDFRNLDPNSDISEKRIVGVLHELLSLFVDHSAQRKTLLCLKKYLGLPQKFHKVFERHPHMFYLSFKNTRCTAILKEPHCHTSIIPEHPILKVRQKYMSLMKESHKIRKNRRINNQLAGKDTDITAAEENYGVGGEVHLS